MKLISTKIISKEWPKGQPSDRNIKRILLKENYFKIIEILDRKYNSNSFIYTVRGFYLEDIEKFVKEQLKSDNENES